MIENPDRLELSYFDRFSQKLKWLLQDCFLIVIKRVNALSSIAVQKRSTLTGLMAQDVFEQITGNKS